MICPKCGDDLSEDAKTCRSCGSRVGEYNENSRIIVIITITIVLILIVLIGLSIRGII